MPRQFDALGRTLGVGLARERLPRGGDLLAVGTRQPPAVMAAAVGVDLKLHLAPRIEMDETTLPPGRPRREPTPRVVVAHAGHEEWASYSATSATSRRQTRSFPAMILICYDGSEDAQAAIDSAAHLLRGQPATMLTVWEHFVDPRTHSGALGMAAFVPDIDDVDERERVTQAAAERASQGAELARAAGLDAEPHSRPRVTSIAEAILLEADATDAELIVVGSRGLTGVKSALLGSVSHALVQHADRPVLVVPSPKIAAERSANRHART